MADLGALIRDWRCRRLAAALVDYGEGTLAPAVRARVARHLEDCARCAEAVAALRDVPRALRGAPVARDEAFWSAQRQRVMQAIRSADVSPEPTPQRGVDWRMALPVAAAAAIALAGYLSLRPPSAPGEVALDALPPEDLAALVEVGGGVVAPEDPLPEVRPTGGAVHGAIEAGWIRADDLPVSARWGDLDADDLDTLNSMVG